MRQAFEHPCIWLATLPINSNGFDCVYATCVSVCVSVCRKKEKRKEVNG